MADIEAAKELGISYYELQDKPAYDRNMALAKIGAERWARQEIDKRARQRNENNRQRSRR